MNTSLNKNLLLSSAIDKLYNESPMARPLHQGSIGHNSSFDTSVHSMQSANSSVLQKMKPTHHLQPSIDNYSDDGRPLSCIGGNSLSTPGWGASVGVLRIGNSLEDMHDNEDDDDGSVLIDKDTTHEILGAMDSNGPVDSRDQDEAPRIAPAVCLTPKFLASRKALALDEVDSALVLDQNANFSKSRELFMNSADDDEEFEIRRRNEDSRRQVVVNDPDDASKLDDIENDVLVSQTVDQGPKTNEYSLSEWTIRPVPNHKCVLVEGLRKNLGKEVLWRSTAIVKALNKRTLQTGSGSVYKLVGPMEMQCMENSGFSSAVCNAFKNGFPTNWRTLIQKHFSDEEEKKCKGEEKQVGKRGRKTKDEKVKKTSRAKKKTELRRTESEKVVARPKPDIYISPSPIEPLDLSTCERTRSGRVVVPSRSVAWWRGVRLYTTPTRPLEIRIDTPIENQLDSPLGWPLMASDKKKDKSLFTPPTGVRRIQRVPKNLTGVPKAEEKKQSSKGAKKRNQTVESEKVDKEDIRANAVPEKACPVAEVKPMRRVTRRGRKKQEEVVKEIDEKEESEAPVNDMLLKSPRTYPAHANESKSTKRSNEKFRQLYDEIVKENQVEAKFNCDVSKVGELNGRSKAGKVGKNDGSRAVPCVLLEHVDGRGQSRGERRLTRSRSRSQVVTENVNDQAETQEKEEKVLAAESKMSEGSVEPRRPGRPRKTATTVQGSNRRNNRSGSQSHSETDSNNPSSKSSKSKGRQQQDDSDSDFSPPKPTVKPNRPRRQTKPVPSSSEADSNVGSRRGRPKSTRQGAGKPSKISPKVVAEVSDNSDTDDEILSAKNRVQEKKELVNQTMNGSLGMNRSLKRRRGHKNSSLSVSMTNDNGEEETLTWTEDEVQRFAKALKTISPDVDEYWSKIAAVVQSKNAEQCRAFHLRDVPQSVKKPKVVQKPIPPPKLVQDQDSVRIQLSGGKGTYKRKRQMQTFLDSMNEDYDNDFFNSTPWLNNKRRKITIPENILNAPVTPLPRVGMVNTPRTQAALQPMEEGKTPVSNVLSPDTLNNAYHEKDDLYIHRCSRLFRGRINANKKKATPRPVKANRVGIEKDSRMIMELCQNEGVNENERDDDQPEDDYFSDADEN